MFRNIFRRYNLNSSNVVFSIKIAGNLQKMLVKIRLLIIDDNSQVFFSQTVPKQLISLL